MCHCLILSLFILLAQEINISFSDGGGDSASAASADDANDDDSDDSDFLLTVISKHRRKSAGEVAGDGRPTPKRSKTIGANKGSPAVGKRKQRSRALLGQTSQSPPVGGKSKSSAAQGPLYLDDAKGVEEPEEVVSINDADEGGADAGDGGEDNAGDGGVRSGSKGAEAAPTPFSRSVAAKKPNGGVSGAKTLVIAPESFDVQDNSKRRKKFQAGLKAVAPDDDSPSTKAGGGGGGGANGGDSISGGAGPARAGAKSEGGLGLARAGDASADKPIAAASSSRQKAKGKAAAAGGVKLTPMEQQVSDLKAQHPGVLLLVECGYRYRFFGDDALTAAKVRLCPKGLRTAYHAR